MPGAFIVLYPRAERQQLGVNLLKYWKTYLSKVELEVPPQIASFFPTHETSLLTCVQQLRSQTLGLTSSRHRAPKKNEWQHRDSNPLAPLPETSIVPLDHAYPHKAQDTRKTILKEIRGNISPSLNATSQNLCYYLSSDGFLKGLLILMRRQKHRRMLFETFPK